MRCRLLVLVYAALLGSAGCGSSDVVVELAGVFDVAPDAPTPKFVAAVRIENRSGEPVVLEGAPVLRVRSVNTGGDLVVPLETVLTPEPLAAQLAPGARFTGVYDLWRMGNLYAQDIFPELRRSPDDMRFRLVVETSDGSVESAEWHGVVRDRSPDVVPGRLESGAPL